MKFQVFGKQMQANELTISSSVVPKHLEILLAD